MPRRKPTCQGLQKLTEGSCLQMCRFLQVRGRLGKTKDVSHVLCLGRFLETLYLCRLRVSNLENHTRGRAQEDRVVEVQDGGKNRDAQRK